MSNNSAVTQQGGEIGRAQVVQAWAARAEPHVDMNPVLLKPGGEDGSQVVLLGQPWKNRDAKTYFSETPFLKEVAYGALTRLRERFDCVVLEGAGSCAEVNLRSREFVNFPAAHAADAPVVLVADIERGGVFAQIIGSLAVMPPEDRRRVVGFIVNRFRGNLELFADGAQYLEEHTQLPVFGVVPFVHQLDIDSEDSLRPDAQLDPRGFSQREAQLRVAVLRIPHISNATDLDALVGLKGVEVHFLSRPRALGAYDWVILPGSKNVRWDLAWLREVGWTAELMSFAISGGRVTGLCGGYQMMGRQIHDPSGIEGEPGTSAGLGLLPVETTLSARKVLGNVRGTWDRYGLTVSGYEIHMGRTETIGDCAGFARAVSDLRLDGRPGVPATPAQDGTVRGDQDGLMSANGKVWGTYLHGLFDSPAFLLQLLTEMRPDKSEDFALSIEARGDVRERGLVAWADHLRKHVQVERLLAHVGLSLT